MRFSDTPEEGFSQVPEAFRELAEHFDHLIDTQYPELLDFPAQVKDSLRDRLRDPFFDDPEVAQLLASRLVPHDPEIRALVESARHRYQELLTKNVEADRARGELVEASDAYDRKPLEEYYRLFGPKTVFIPVGLGTKKPKYAGWQKTTFEQTQTPQLRAELAEGNLGIVLGQASGNLVDLDCDTVEALEEFLRDNPWASDTLQTRGARGRHFFFRLRGDYPQKVIRIFHAGSQREQIGEWRGGNGSQTVIGGLHESGCNYLILNDKPVLEVTLEQFKRPSQWKAVWDTPASRAWEPDWDTTSRDGEQAKEYGPPDQLLHRRIAGYMARVEPSIAGEHGDDQLWRVALKLIVGWGLSLPEALPYMEAFNARCEPPWPLYRLHYKLQEALEHGQGVRGRLRDQERETAQQWTERKQREAREEAQRKAGIPQQEEDSQKQRVFIEFLSPSQIIAYKPPADLVLVGDYHLVRGTVVVIGGPPGVGKSRSTLALAEAGATKFEWFGYPIHCHFKTLVIQNENGLFRLQREIAEIDQPALEEYLRVCPPPPYGMCFWRDEFRDQLKRFADYFGPHAVAIDPWNAVARDERAKDYLETFDIIRQVFPQGEVGPVIVISAHTRKPTDGERANGRALLNLLVGSYVLGSVPRVVFIMQHASDEVTEDRVVWTCCKNNDGGLGQQSAWVRQNGIFMPVDNFDWASWKQGGKEEVFPLEKMVEIIEENGGTMRRAKLAKAISDRGPSRATAYRRIDEAENAGLIKRQKGKDVFEIVR